MPKIQQTQTLSLVDSELESVKELVSEVFDSASIRDFKVSRLGNRQFTVIVPSDYHVPQICLKQLESKGYFLQTLHCGTQGLEITLGGNKK